MRIFIAPTIETKIKRYAASVARRLHAKRAAAGISQGAAAAVIGVGARNYKRMEAGEGDLHRLPTILRIMTWLDVSFEDLFK